MPSRSMDGRAIRWMEGVVSRIAKPTAVAPGAVVVGPLIGRRLSTDPAGPGGHPARTGPIRRPADPGPPPRRSCADAAPAAGESTSPRRVPVRAIRASRPQAVHPPARARAGDPRGRLGQAAADVDAGVLEPERRDEPRGDGERAGPVVDRA